MITWDAIAPTEVLLSGINWTSRLGGTDTIASSTWSASSPAGLTLTGPSFSNVNGSNYTYITVSGAVLGTLYSITNTIVTASGQTEIETVQFVCALK
jgi:hypothetical protein